MINFYNEGYQAGYKAMDVNTARWRDEFKVVCQLAGVKETLPRYRDFLKGQVRGAKDAINGQVSKFLISANDEQFG